jgi:hypothetical protein
LELVRSLVADNCRLHPLHGNHRAIMQLPFVNNTKAPTAKHIPLGKVLGGSTEDMDRNPEIMYIEHMNITKHTTVSTSIRIAFRCATVSAIGDHDDLGQAIWIRTSELSRGWTTTEAA